MPGHIPVALAIARSYVAASRSEESIVMGEADLGPVVQHKLVGIALHLVEAGALTTTSKRLGSALRHIRNGQTGYQRAMLDEASAICSAAAQNGIRVAVRKGPLIAGWFTRKEDRQFSDIDLLLSEHDKAAITKLLEARGYVPALYSFATTSLASHPRATQIRYAMSITDSVSALGALLLNFSMVANASETDRAF